MKPMKAATAEEKDLANLPYPLLVSPKIDAIRGIVQGNKILSSKLRKFPNPHVHRLFGSPLLNNLDGELLVGDDPSDQQSRNKTSGHLNSPKGTSNLTFWVFDIVDTLNPYCERYRVLRNIIPNLAHKGFRVRLVQQYEVVDANMLLGFERSFLKEGYEGIVIRHPEARYKFGRSTLNEAYMVKLKRFKDAEAQVLEVLEEMENTNEAERDNLGHTKRSKKKAGMKGKGRAGKLRVRGVNGRFKGVEFFVSLSRAGDKGKKEWWELRKAKRLPIITYRYFTIGLKDKPLLTTYVGIRERWDR